MQLWPVLLVACAVLAEGLHSPLGKQFPKKSRHVAPGVGGDALFLTPYIEAGDLETARALSKVRVRALTEQRKIADKRPPQMPRVAIRIV